MQTINGWLRIIKGCGINIKSLEIAHQAQLEAEQDIQRQWFDHQSLTEFKNEFPQDWKTARRLEFLEQLREKLNIQAGIIEVKYMSLARSDAPHWLRLLMLDLNSYEILKNQLKSTEISLAMAKNGTQIGYSLEQISQARSRQISEFYGEGNKRCHCPFHDAKTPGVEFAIYGNSAYCHSCQWSGDVIKFIMDFERLSFPDAMKFLL